MTSMSETRTDGLARLDALWARGRALLGTRTAILGGEIGRAHV